MSNVSIILSCVAVAVFALIWVSVINTRQTRKRLINQRLMQLKRRVSELEELAVALESLLGSTRIATLILDEVADTLRGMIQIAPNSQTMELTLSNTLQHQQEISSASYQPQLNRLQETDAQIARAQYLLGEAGRVVRKRQSAGALEVSEMNHFIEELAWAHLMVGVVSLTAQGHKAMLAGNVLRAFAFYKKAQQSAASSTIADERRHQFIKELGEILANKRKSISLSLMPESGYNPDTVPQRKQTKRPAADRRVGEDEQVQVPVASQDPT